MRKIRIKTVICFSVNAVLSLPLALLADEKIPEVVVTSTRIEREVFNTPQAVTIINDKQIDEANVTATPDLFRNAEGVYIQKTNLGGGSPFIRGLTGKQVLVLVDGMRLNNSFYRFGPHQYLNTIDQNSIERVEVVRGPSSVMYGSDALGGVVNIITKKRTDFLDPFGIEGLANATYDSATAGTSYADIGGGYATHLQGEGNWENFGWLVGGSAKSYDDLLGGGDTGQQVPSGYRQYDGNMKLNYQFQPGTELQLGFQYLNQLDVPKTNEVTLGGKLQFNYQPQERAFTYIEYHDSNLSWFDDLKFNISYNSQVEGEEIIDNLPTETRELTEVGTLGTTLQLTNSLFDNTHRVTYGAEFYHDDYDTRKHSINLNTGLISVSKPGVPDGATYDNFGLFVQDEFDVTDRLNFILGGRYSQFSAEGALDHPTEGKRSLALDVDQFTGSLQGLYKITPNLNFIAGVSEGFRAPNMEDFFGRVDFTSEIPNTGLKPEESVNYEVGFKYLDEKMSADIHYFYADYENLIDRVDTLDALGEPVKQRRNVNEATIQGIEGGFHYDFNPHWRLSGTIAWTQGRDNKEVPIRRIPPLNGAWQLRYTHNPQFWVELDSFIANKQDELSDGDKSDLRIPEGGTPGYVVFSLKSGFKRTKNETLSITFENMFDEQYKTHGSGLFAPGRSVVASYSIKF
ncbi:colicin I receptor [Methyloglobulus morosus KoM1]|uniref:Colicin I receptor n=1 Tax=Methyloglobulus morosus KoM1 TaxID=1116472 RepID=V5C5S9_9GAMM|nr:TonB-dependent receptor [Methyloglobulus morosus]ESS72088.1 colicin I receptor [Methyloglobulus morosus KoM1]